MQSLRDLNLNSLRIVESAARTGSFVRAAEEQLLTPSAVSQRIKNLEAQLRFKIFNRRNNSVVLTTEGDAFVAHVRDALDTILSAGLEAKAVNRETIIKVDALPTFIVRWLMPRLPDFNVCEPDVRLSLSHSYTPVNFTKVDCDVSIQYGNGDFPGLHSKLLFTEELTPVCSPALLERVLPNSNGDMAPADLAKFILLHSDTCTMNWKYWLEDMEVPSVLTDAKSADFDSCMLTYDAATQGLGFAIANYVYMMEDIENGKLVAPFRQILRSGCGWYLVYPKSNEYFSRVEKFENWILKQASSTKQAAKSLRA